MKRIKLMMDHRQWVDGKEKLFKAGETILVTDKVYDYIVKAVIAKRTKDREIALKTHGTPEWKAARNDH